jgi:nucleoside-diphosphate-sugar epimerase
MAPETGSNPGTACRDRRCLRSIPPSDAAARTIRAVAGRNSGNTLIKKTLGWEPDTSLRAGMEKTYAGIYNEMTKRK